MIQPTKFGGTARWLRDYAAFAAVLVLTACAPQPPAKTWAQMDAETHASVAKWKAEQAERDQRDMAERVAMYRAAAGIQARLEVGAEKAGAPAAEAWGSCVGRAAGKLAAHSGEPAMTIVAAAFGMCGAAEQRAYDAWAAQGGTTLADGLRFSTRQKLAESLAASIATSRARMSSP